MTRNPGPAAADQRLNRAAGLLAGAADSEADYLDPTIGLRCMTALALLSRAGAVADVPPSPHHPAAVAAALRQALALLAQLPPALFDTDPVLDAVTEVMLAYQATG